MILALMASWRMPVLAVLTIIRAHWSLRRMTAAIFMFNFRWPLGWASGRRRAVFFYGW